MSDRSAALLVGSVWHHAEVGGPIISEHLGEVGFDVTITEDRDILCAQGLADLDLFVMWAEGCTTSDCDDVRWMTEGHAQALADWVGAGHGFLGLHSATAFFGQDVYDRMIGGVFLDHPPIHEFPVRVTDAGHPVTEGVADFVIEDELYLLRPVVDDLQVLLEAEWEGITRPLGWARSHGAGRVCYLANGHDEAALRNPAVERLIQNGAGWCGAAAG